MPKPVPSDEVSGQTVEGSHEELKTKEQQEDLKAQQLAAQAAKQTSTAQLPSQAP